MSGIPDAPKAFTMPDGDIYHIVNLHGVEKAPQGWKIKDTPANPKLINFGSQWSAMRPYVHGQLTKKQSRAFNVVKSGMTLGIARKERLIFMTLSTKYAIGEHVYKLRDIKKLNYAFTKLKQKIERYLRRLMYIRACKKNHKIPFIHKGINKESIRYPNIYAKCTFKLQYFKVKTSEGGGVLHIIFRKGRNVPKIDKNWLHETWAKMWHDSWNTSLHEIKYNDADRQTWYTIGNYVQHQPVLRMSYGYQWVYHGFRKSFLKVIRTYGFDNAKKIWKNRMQNNDLPIKGRQTRFRYYIHKQKYNKKYFQPDEIERKDINPKHIQTRYPKNCYQWEQQEDLRIFKAGKYQKIQPEPIRIRQKSFPREKIVLTQTNINVETEQTHFNLLTTGDFLSDKWVNTAPTVCLESSKLKYIPVY